MKQTDFRGERGAYHLECYGCNADVHLINWNAREERQNPSHCPYCGSDEIWIADEAVRNSESTV